MGEHFCLAMFVLQKYFMDLFLANRIVKVAYPLEKKSWIKFSPMRAVGGENFGCKVPPKN